MRESSGVLGRGSEVAWARWRFPAELVAALSGSEASDLPWLGGGKSKQAKAHMHLYLRPRQALY